ncbi:MAG: hypothetical protein DRH26_08800 [Deltaproteobacteria bacterium]|nr:MAG: hypothetical protein DRH26_08800 [Deltaproteobacteria bacterium]
MTKLYTEIDLHSNNKVVRGQACLFDVICDVTIFIFVRMDKDALGAFGQTLLIRYFFNSL